MVFLTGITGLVGSFIARELLAKGFKIRALRRVDSDLSWIEDIASHIDWIEGDVLDISSLEAGIADCEYVIHCAAIVSFAPKDRQAMYKVNVEGTQNVVNVCLHFRPRKLLFISSVAALGRTKESQTLTESSKWQDSDLNSNYAKTKHLAEMEVWRGSAEGLPVVILNPSVVLGPSDWHKTSTRIFKYVWDEKMFYSRGTINYVDVRDVADIAQQLLVSPIENQRFIINAGKTSFEDCFELIAQNFQKKKPKYPINSWIAEIAWRFFAFTSMLTGKAPLVTKETARIAQTSFYYANDKICQTLNFQFRPLAETVAWTCQVLKQRLGK
ncbi:MAG: NAD-dependent epimerase/dehydratase family protein [Microscillaceae bacterium]|jgi:nucleoside-diphosphate-sugar epimerase|nr:NAD-dependent epimerase/dehydratase family protein [Microscillaceae bacterium]